MPQSGLKHLRDAVDASAWPDGEVPDWWSDSWRAKHVRLMALERRGGIFVSRLADPLSPAWQPETTLPA